ncbi:hypothetical protein POX_a00739 [Penicillium oxalicum]|uniref:hypothetical protein n=1 Tax=Penicillium oxalicum TaxID=69781 RepID=UPI0020B83E6C|nr:hypothetical protein POX_a00739 [Penicillium oxalicum]KAI2794149.1 hypothetical protein POX_a00739 [Penicillium oxalicum]
MIYGNRSIYDRGLRTHQEHARRFGYPVSVLRKPIMSGTYSKCAILLSEMLRELEKPPGERLEWLFWFDSDSVLMNANMPLEVFLPPPRLSEVHLLLTKDWNGLNNGVYFIRVNEWSVRLISATISYHVLNPDVPLAWQDQSALKMLVDEHEYFSKHVVYCPLRWFNAYMRSPDALQPNPDSPDHLQVHPGDLLVHFPGTPSEHLDQTLSPYLEIAENHVSEWEPPLEQTGYTEITKDFWDQIN